MGNGKTCFCERSLKWVHDKGAKVNFICIELPVLAVNLVFSQLLESWDYMRVLATSKKWKGKQKTRTFDSLQKKEK